MQSGSYYKPIVHCMKGLSFYRNSHITEMKKAAHRAHRSRVKQDLKQAVDAPDMELDLNAYENLNTWDVW